ncbi:MAG TPA: universal stress protein [Gemmataceae bacterium]|jgi:nucleotide-binding universal stress UspA family protein
MYRTILVPLDGSKLAEQALPLALAVARRAHANLRLARVHRPTASGGRTLPSKGVAASELAYVEAIADAARRTGLPVETTLLEGPVPAALCKHAQAVNASLMVLTTHGRGPLSRFWLGSTADDLVRRTPVPLLIHRPDPAGDPQAGTPLPPNADFRFRRVLVPLDGSDVAEEALGPAAEMARIMGADLTFLRVVEPVPLVVPDGLVYTPPTLDTALMDDLTAQARNYVGHAAARWEGEGLDVETRVMVNDAPAAAVLEAAEGHDLIALATHGRSRMARLFLGSVADKVVRGAHCPVLVVRHPHTRPEGGKP